MFSQIKQLKSMREEARKSVAHSYDGDGREIIDMSVSCDDDFLSPYYVGDNRYISGELAEFLDEAVKPLDVRRGLHIAVKGDTIDENEQTVYRAAFKNYYSRRIAEDAAKLRRNLIGVVIMLVIAVAVLAVYVALEVAGYNHVVLELVDIIGWVFMWEAVDQFAFERGVLKREYVRDGALYGAVITYE